MEAVHKTGVVRLPIGGDVDATVDALCEVQRQHGIAFSVAVGRIVVEGIYGGDAGQVHARRKDCPTLRALAAHPRVPFSATALHHAIGIYQLCARNPGVLDTELTVTHLRAVLPLPAEVQDQLLSRAVAGGWTTQTLQRAARGAKTVSGKGGRSRLPQVVKTLTRLDRVARDAEAWAELDAVAGLTAERRVALREAVERLELRLRGLRLWLDARGEGVSGDGGRADEADEGRGDAAT